jgi:hypothetical protein
MSDNADNSESEVSREARTPAKRRHSDLFSRRPALICSTPKERTVQRNVERDRNVSRRRQRDAYESRRNRIEAALSENDNRSENEENDTDSNASLYASVSSLFQNESPVNMAPKLIGA